MDNVRILRYDWYTGLPGYRSAGEYLARQYDHLSDMVVLSHAPKLDNYYLIVTMKETEDGDVKTLEPIQLSGSFWLIPNIYTQLAQTISFQVCCKTESGDFENHSAEIRGRILPSKDHSGEALDVDPSVMFDPYKKWVEEKAMASGAIVIDSELSSSSTNPVQNRIVKAAIDGLVDDVDAVNGRLRYVNENIKAINNTDAITITQSTQYTAFDFDIGKRYALYNGTNNSMNAYTMTAPSASGTAIEAIGTNIQPGATVVFEPTINASYARFYCNGRGTVTVSDISNGVPKLTIDVAKLQEESATYIQKNGKAQVTEQNTTFFEQTTNLFDKDNVTDNYDIKQNGSGLYEATGYMATEYYIDVSAYNSIKPLRWTGSAVVNSTIRYVLYNENKVALNQRTNTNKTIDTSNASFLRFGASLGAKDTLMVVPGDINPTVYVPYGFAFKYGVNQMVEINPSDDIIQKILDNKGKNIHFNAGAYDIISQYESHFGNDYFTNYTGYESGGNNLGRGLPVYRGTKVTFSQGAVFTANYTGSNTAVRTNFAAFAIETGVEINGLCLITSGIRNCIHDDFDNNVSGETIIKNCHFTSDTNIIAGGLGVHDILVIENCYFDRTNDAHQFDFSYHNNSGPGAQSMVIIKDNYMKHGVSIRWYGASTLLTDVLISNNSMANVIDYHEENASATIENINLVSWNNEIRTT